MTKIDFLLGDKNHIQDEDEMNESDNDDFGDDAGVIFARKSNYCRNSKKISAQFKEKLQT